MGNSSSSSSSKSLTREEQDIKYLADRFAFGDAELWHLYQAYQAIFHTDNDDNNNVSFLTDWAIQSTLILEQQERKKQQKHEQQQQQVQLKRQHDNTQKRGGVHVEEQHHHESDNTNNHLSRMSEQEFQNEHLPALQQERLDSLQVVEQQILPRDFGNRLYRATCVVPGDTAAASLYNSNNSDSKIAAAAVASDSAVATTSTSTKTAVPVHHHIVMDEYTRRARLTQMFEGFSNMGRRGSKAYLQVMFQACQHQKQRKRISISSTFDGTAAAAAATTSTVVSALEMVDMGYRLALAAEYLHQRSINFHNNKHPNKTTDSDSSPGDPHIDNDGTNDGADKNVIEQDDDNDNIMAVDVASLLPPPPCSWSLDDLSLSSRSCRGPVSTRSTLNNSSLRALARSMIEKGKRRRERSSNASDGGGMMFQYPQYHNDNVISDKNVKSDPDNDNQNSDDDDGFVELDDIVEWSEEVAPLFASALPTFMYRILFPGKPFPPSQTPFSYPRILQESSFFVGTDAGSVDKCDADNAVLPVVVHANASPLLFELACFSSSLSGLYYRLYTSASDGLSFNRLQNALLGYSGPTCIIIRAVADDDEDDHAHGHDSPHGDDDYKNKEGGIFGAVSASPWKESKDFYGTSDCFLFQLSPITAVYRPTSVARSVDNSKSKTGHNKDGKSQKSSGPNYMYCNPNARSKGYDGQAHGIGFGGTLDQPRLFLDETFEQCYAGSQDWTFENGNLLPPSNNRRKQYFQVESLEVWGVGGTALVEKALDARQLARDVRQEGIRRARKVDKAQFLDDFRSGAMDSKAFAHRQQMDGRADQDCNERHTKKYDYEK